MALPRILHRQYPQQKHAGGLCAGRCCVPALVRRAGDWRTRARPAGACGRVHRTAAKRTVGSHGQATSGVYPDAVRLASNGAGDADEPGALCSGAASFGQQRFNACAALRGSNGAPNGHGGCSSRASNALSSSTSWKWQLCNRAFTRSTSSGLRISRFILWPSFLLGYIVTARLYAPLVRSDRMELANRVQVEELPEGAFLATSEEVPGLVAQGRTVAEALDIAHDVARKPIEARRR